MITDKNEKTMNCGLESCRFNADGECCNAEAYQQCINACEAVLGEEYQMFKELRANIVKALKEKRFTLRHAFAMYFCGGKRFCVCNKWDRPEYICKTIEEAENDIKRSERDDLHIVDLKTWGACSK